MSALKPDFSHRLSIFGTEATAHNLNDAIGTMAYQATNSLTLVSQQFLGDDEATKASDEVIYWTIDAAIKTVQDMRAIVDAYCLVEYAKKPEHQAAA